MPANGRLPEDRSLLGHPWQHHDDRPYLDVPLDSWMPDCEDANDDPRYQDEESVVEPGFWE